MNNFEVVGLVFLILIILTSHICILQNKRKKENLLIKVPYIFLVDRRNYKSLETQTHKVEKIEF
jgi:hypothetical protein